MDLSDDGASLLSTPSRRALPFAWTLFELQTKNGDGRGRTLIAIGTVETENDTSPRLEAIVIDVGETVPRLPHVTTGEGRVVRRGWVLAACPLLSEPARQAAVRSGRRRGAWTPVDGGKRNGSFGMLRWPKWPFVHPWLADSHCALLKDIQLACRLSRKFRLGHHAGQPRAQGRSRSAATSR